MNARALLDEARAHGVTLYRLGDRVRWRARSPVPAELLARLREHKAELSQLLPDYDAIYRALTAAVGMGAVRDD